MAKYKINEFGELEKINEENNESSGSDNRKKTENEEEETGCFDGWIKFLLFLSGVISISCIGAASDFFDEGNGGIWIGLFVGSLMMSIGFLSMISHKIKEIKRGLVLSTIGAVIITVVGSFLDQIWIMGLAFIVFSIINCVVVFHNKKN